MTEDRPHYETTPSSPPDEQGEWCQLSPEELIAHIYQPRQTSMASERRSRLFHGKWMQVRGIVDDVQPIVADEWYFLWVHQTGERPKTVCAEIDESQFSDLQRLLIGDEVLVTGKISKVEESMGGIVSLNAARLDRSKTRSYSNRIIEPIDETNAPGWFIAKLAESLRMIDVIEGNDGYTSELLNYLDSQLNELAERVDYLKPTTPRGAELRYLMNRLRKWYEDSPEIEP